MTSTQITGSIDSVAAAEVFGLVLVVLGCALAAILTRGNHVGVALERLKLNQAAPIPEILARRRRPDETGLQRLFHKIDATRWLERSMWEAGIYTRVSDMVLLMVLLFGTGEVIAGTFIDSLLLSIAVGVALAALPMLYIRFRRKRRLKQFTDQLPFVLDLLKSLLEAGHSLLRGLQVVVKEFEPPIGSEFATVLEQTTLGLPLARALQEMAARVPQEDLRLLVVAVKVQAEVGSSLAQIIGRLSEIMRTRQRLRAQIKALTAQSRMSGVIVGLLPVFVLLAFSIVQPGYARALFTDPTGIRMLETAVVLDVLALVTIRRLVRVRY
jgi:tight adherence protein B